MEFFGACPLDCPDGCSWVVTVEDGEATRLRGNRDHPYTAGALCAKVNGYLDHVRADDRLLYPLRRVGAKGEGKFERISWDEATAEIAQRLHAVKDEFGGEAIWPFQGTGSLGYVQGLEGRAGQPLWNVLGASRHEMTACSVAGRIGASYTTGTASGMDPEAFAHSKLIILWGTNPLTSGHHVFKFMREAQKNGAYVVSIDPIKTRTAERADEWLAPLPGSDAALALGLLHVVLERGAEDREYIAQAHRRLRRVRAAHPAVPAREGRGAHRPAGGADQGARRAARHHPAHRHPLHPGHAAPRRRRRRAADDVRHPGRDRRLAVPGRRRFVLDQRPLHRQHRRRLARRPARAARPHAQHDAAGRPSAQPRRPAGEGAHRLPGQPDGLQPGPEARPRGPHARGPVHRRDGAVPDRHRRLRRHRPARDDADRAPRRQRRLRALLHPPQPPGDGAARRGALDARDVPADRPRDGPHRARAVRERRGGRAHAARRRPASTSSGTAAGSATCPSSSSRSPMASRRPPASSSSTPRRRSGTVWTRSPATRRHRRPRRTRTTRSR